MWQKMGMPFEARCKIGTIVSKSGQTVVFIQMKTLDRPSQKSTTTEYQFTYLVCTTIGLNSTTLMHQACRSKQFKCTSKISCQGQKLLWGRRTWQEFCFSSHCESPAREQ